MTLTGALAPLINDGDDLFVSIWWTQSWGCPALHFEERIPPIVGCDAEWSER
jgi:hypothetical protein